MIQNFYDSGFHPKGHLTIHKIVNGSEELVFDEKNIIVSGFGVTLSYLFSKLGSNNIADFQIDRFQLGISGTSAKQVSSTYQLGSPLSSTTQYVGTGDSNLSSFTSNQIANGAKATSKIFASIPFNKVSKINDNTVRYTIFIDEDSCNSLDNPLNEIGLFVKNPTGVTPDSCILVAYKYFSDIVKTTSFALIFRWTLSF